MPQNFGMACYAQIDNQNALNTVTFYFLTYITEDDYQLNQ